MQHPNHEKGPKAPETYSLSDGTVREITIEPPPLDPEQMAQQKKQRRRRARGLITTLVVFLVLVGLLTLARLILVEPMVVNGESMVPTLLSGESVMVTKFDYWREPPELLDVVLCWYPDEQQSFIKRVVGLPGDVVELRAGSLYVNGEEVPQPFVENWLAEDFGPVTVEEGHYCVMGDNRQDSRDSRDPTVGNVPASEIIGHARFVFYPFDQRRSLARGQ